MNRCRKIIPTCRRIVTVVAGSEPQKAQVASVGGSTAQSLPDRRGLGQRRL
jgi:hypothetical protein